VGKRVKVKKLGGNSIDETPLFGESDTQECTLLWRNLTCTRVDWKKLGIKRLYKDKGLKN